MTANGDQDLQSQVNALREQLGSLQKDVTRLNDIQDIRTLHFKYGYYWDNVLYEQWIDLFTDDVKVRSHADTHANIALLSWGTVPWQRRGS